MRIEEASEDGERERRRGESSDPGRERGGGTTYLHNHDVSLS